MAKTRSCHCGGAELPGKRKLILMIDANMSEEHGPLYCRTLLLGEQEDSIYGVSPRRRYHVWLNP